MSHRRPLMDIISKTRPEMSNRGLVLGKQIFFHFPLQAGAGDSPHGSAIEEGRGTDDELRRVQESSERLAPDQVQLYHSGSRRIDDSGFDRTARGLGRRLGSVNHDYGNTAWLVGKAI